MAPAATSGKDAEEHGLVAVVPCGRTGFRRGPRFLAQLDKAHLGGKLYAARQPGFVLCHLGGMGFPAAAAYAAVPGGTWRRAAWRRPACAHQPAVLTERTDGRRVRRGDGNVL